MADKISPEELERERQLVYPPPPGCDQAAYYASREAQPSPAAAAPAAATTTSSSNNNNNDDDDDDDLAVARAGPATALPDDLIDPRLLPAAPAPAPPAAAAAAQPAPPARPARRPWTDAEVNNLVARRRAGESFVQIGRALNRTRAACETKAKKLVYKYGINP